MEIAKKLNKNTKNNQDREITGIEIA